MAIRFIAAICALAFSLPAMAGDLSGTWAVKSGDTTIFRFDIAHEKQAWTATWERPATMGTDGESFSHLAGPLSRRPAAKIVADGDALDLTFDDPRPGATPDVFRITAKGADHADATYLALASIGITPEPMALTREPANAPIGPWDADATYAVSMHWPTNDEMTAIFNADQDSRKAPSTLDAKTFWENDRKRRERTGELLDQGNCTAPMTTTTRPSSISTAINPTIT